METAKNAQNQTYALSGHCETDLNATIKWPWLDTGLARSRYIVKLSSRHRTSGAFDPGGKEGERGECEGVCIAVATMPHIGQPGFGEKFILRGCSCAGVESFQGQN